MATFSVSDALGAGFDVIRRRPLSVLVWGLAYFVLGVLPTLGLFALVGEDFLAFFQQAASNPHAEPDMESWMRLNSTMTAYQPVAFLTSIAAKAVLAAAVFRAVLEPENRGFFYLRLGKDELWQALIYLCLCIIVAITAVIAVLVGGALGAGVWFAGEAVGSPWAGWLQALGLIAVVVAAGGTVLWFCLRLSLAAPMSFSDRTFRLFESWELTKGQGWRLFGLAVLLVLVMFAIEIALGVLSWGALATFLFSGGFDPEAIEAFFQQPPQTWATALVPIVLGFAVVGALVTGAVYAIFTAPWAVAYRQLRGASAEA